MRRDIFLTALAVAGCTGEPEPSKDADTGDEPLPQAPAHVAVAGATYDSAFKSTCSVKLDLADAASGNALATTSLAPFDGGLWDALPLVDGQQYKATITWDDCENTPDGTGSFTSSTFSGEPGDLFVLHYDGVDAGFEWMVQGDDHRGGSVHVALAEGVEASAVAGSIGAVAVADSAEPALTYLDWTDDRNVAAVLDDLTGDGTISWGEPTWTEKPAWW